VRVLIVDGANVVGSRPDGWWRDRAGAAKRLHDAIVRADLPYDRIVLVLEGAAKAGQPMGVVDHVETTHARGSGDDAIVDEARTCGVASEDVVVVTADQGLRERVEDVGASCIGPSALLDQLP